MRRFRYDNIFDLVSPDIFMLFAYVSRYSLIFFSTVSSLKFWENGDKTEVQK